MSSIIEHIVNSAHGTELNLPDTCIEKMGQHFDLMLKWNKTHNITRITDSQEAAQKHYLDSLLGLSFVPTAPDLFDMGSGGGFPGLVAAIVRPQQKTYLVEPARKRVSFLERVRKELGLENLRIIHGRAEDQENLSLVISRGTFSWPNIEPITSALGAGGQFFMWFGQAPTEDAFGQQMGEIGFSSQWHAYELPQGAKRFIGQGISKM